MDRIKPSAARWIYLAVSVVLVVGGLLAAASRGYMGFPLDDAWIHQTYARSLAQTGMWAFIPGELSTGSTAPLWTVLMAGGPLLRLQPVIWSAIAGALCLAILAELARRAIAAIVPGKRRWAFWGGLLLVFEWHMVWAALSGMETLLFAAVGLAIFGWLVSGSPGSIRTGFTIGVAVWLRPDAIVLLLPSALVLLLSDHGHPKKWIRILQLGIAFLAPVLPYLLMNLALSGEVWPATYFAKQAEYLAIRALPLVARMFDQAQVPLVGVGIALLPWVLLEIADSLRRRRWGISAGAIWLLAMIGLYAARLPVTYQHGRYLMPVIPVFFVIGWAGAARFSMLTGRSMWPRVLSRVGIVLIPVLSLVFLGFGLRAYGRDVAVIETEMVATARWISTATSPGALIAAHDIGALGYFGGRRIIDLAGLVSPEVVSIIRDEAALAALLDDRGARYLMTLEGWYPGMEDGLTVVFRTDAEISPSLGGTNMVVYRWGSER